jgi:Tol biopolymer transport system component
MDNEANRSSGIPSISADGRFVVFDSFASNLVPDDINERGDIFVHDRLTGQTTRVNIDNMRNEIDSSIHGASISADGRFVAFSFRIVTSLDLEEPDFREDVFVHDRQTGQTTRVSVDSMGNGTDINRSSRMPSISADGRFVAFSSRADNLVLDDTNGAEDVFVPDRLLGQTTRVCVVCIGNEANNTSKYPSISADGRFVAFSSFADNLVPDSPFAHF